MAIMLNEFFSTIESNLGHRLDDPQRAAIGHGTGPLWVIAGPGTGKTEVLVDRCLKLICVDDISPLSVLLTTFTEKAATSLQDRLYDHLARLQTAHSPHLDPVDISDLRVGTLHSLCNDIMQEYRHVDYQNVRLLDEVEQSLFIRDTRARVLRSRTEIWSHLPYLRGRRGQQSGHPPNLWQVTRAAKMLFNRVVEDGLDLNRMRTGGAPWPQVVEEYEAYVGALHEAHRCDFSHLQARFIDFLQTPRGQQFLMGDGSPHAPGIEYVLVDEYQDTNPIQEDVYVRLANRPPHNLTVVGDDDQALYRFRGGTVECMVEFGHRCQTNWSGSPVTTVSLVDNHRSHPQIVQWCNEYVASFPSMGQPGARAPGKRPLSAASSVQGDYPAVGWISATRASDLPAQFVTTVAGLHSNGIVSDYSQCALLLPSARETPRNAGPYATALRKAGIPVYNPRSKAYVERQEVAVAMGAFLEIVDPGQRVASSIMIAGVSGLASDWASAYQRGAGSGQGLADYVSRSRDAIRALGPDEQIRPAMPTILYRILSFEPFVTWQLDQERDGRLSKLTRLFEAYCSLVGRPLFTDRHNAGEVRRSWLGKLYYLLMGYLDAVGMDDDELGEEVCPAGRLPIMTIHQAKGLQFPFVFVGAVARGASPGDVHRLEDDIRLFRPNPLTVAFNAETRAEHDLIRMFYVAYSRAQWALILLATRSQLSPCNRPAAGGQGLGWFNQRVQRL